jgi:RimJ/RimL family protein N-acetyltransferase
VILTERLSLRPLTPIYAAQVADGAPRDVNWADDFPFEGDQTAAGMYLHAGAPAGPWVPYVISVQATGRAIGGVGYHGEPDPDGVLQIGYGLVPSARGHGYAREALGGLVGFARAHGAKRIIAGLEYDNVPSRKVLLANGFQAADDRNYALDL